MRRWLVRAAVATALAGAGFVGGLYVDTRHDDQYVPVHCPEEDSCTVDYDGFWERWEITPTQP